MKRFNLHPILTRSPLLFIVLTASLVDSSLLASGNVPGKAGQFIPQADTSIHHYEYVFPDGWIYVYDIDNDHKLIDSMSVPTSGGTRGVAASPTDGMLYISYNGDGGFRGNGSLLQYNLLSKRVGWNKNFFHGIDSHDISPDGKIIYMPDGELTADGKCYIVNAADGAETGTIIATNNLGPHNVLTSLDGSRLYIGDRDPNNAGNDYLYVASTATGAIIQKVGPVPKGIRPFTVNGMGTLAYISMTGLLGFHVGDLTTGKILYTVDLTTMGYSISRCVTDGFNGNNCQTSHGISLSPDETEVYVIDSPNSYIHVFDVSGVGNGIAPRKIADIHLNHGFLGQAASCAYDCLQIGWLQHSLDGKYVYVGDSGDIIFTATHSIVGFLPAMRNTRKTLEIDWQNGRTIAATSREGRGYVIGSSAPAAPALLLPVNGALDQPVNPRIVWRDIDGATSYDLQMSLDSLFASIVLRDSTLTDSTIQLSHLPVNSTYYWHVRAKNAGGVSAWSSASRFVTGNLVGIANSLIATGWNMVSVPLQVGPITKEAIFPSALSEAFRYENRYLMTDTVVPGTGYWLKFNADTLIDFLGIPLLAETVVVQKGWNMVGSLSDAAPVAAITSNPPGMVTTGFYGYNNGYSSTDSLYPGKAYWVKVAQDGLIMVTGGSLMALWGEGRAGRIQIIPGREIPPPPPDEELNGTTALRKDYFLGQNYPNPFNPTTNVEYRMPDIGFVTLKIFDQLGREVATLVHGIEPPGSMSVEWDGSGLASGVYYYRLDATSISEPAKHFSQIRRMILSK